MKVNRVAITTALAAGIGLCAVLTESHSAHAQGAANRRVFRPIPSRSTVSPNGYAQNGPTANSQNGMGGGMNGMGSGANGAGPGSNPGGGSGSQTPLAQGTIIAGDASTGRILIQSQSNGSNQALQVSNATRFVTQTAISTSDLQTGEFVQVQGVVTSGTTGTASMTASVITAGHIPAFLQQQNSSPQNSQMQNNQQQNSRAAGRSGSASGRTSATPSTAAAQNSNGVTLTGLVTSVSPLVVALNNGASVTIKNASDTQVNRVTPLLFRNLQVGDQLKATGMATSSGFVLTDVAINM